MSLWQDPTAIVFLITTFFVGFYIAGTIVGRRRVAKLYKDIREAVLGAGGKIVDGRYGATTAIMSCRDMSFLTEFSIVIGVQTWSNPLAYIISRSMGRFDLVILRARLSTTPKSSFTLIKKDAPARRYASRWGSVVGEIDGYLMVARESDHAVKAAEHVFDKLRAFKNIMLLSLNNELPHLQLYFKPEERYEIKALLAVLEKLI